ncbi:MAG: sigma-70 family RNA polymerase sigma factor [Bacteroidales bacterium]|nr:MAG: sigma-70 family RNA polymerase sigma factor [Bacteroidales bacterium]
MDDHELIIKVLQNDDHSAFALLVDKYQKLVVNTCRGFVNSYADAEDLAQDVFIELFESLPNFRHESKLSTWIYRIAVNKSLNFVRKRKRETLFDSFTSFFGSSEGKNGDSGIDFSSNEADSNIKSKELRIELKRAINALPENQRIAFILNKYQELSYKEVAEVMNISLSSVESLLFRAKGNLQKSLSVFYKNISS